MKCKYQTNGSNGDEVCGCGHSEWWVRNVGYIAYIVDMLRRRKI